MLNGAVESDPVFPVLWLFKYHDDTGSLPGLDRVVERLTNGLGPLFSKIELNGVGGRDAVGAGLVGKHHLGLSAMLRAPLSLVVLFRACIPGKG